MQQLVMAPTRGDRILDVLLTKGPFLWKKGTVHKGLVRSNHLVVIVPPLVPGRPSKKFVSFRDTRDPRKIAVEVKLELCDWSDILGLDDLKSV